jgi:hypothetical protein
MYAHPSVFADIIASLAQCFEISVGACIAYASEKVKRKITSVEKVNTLIIKVFFMCISFLIGYGL